MLTDKQVELVQDSFAILVPRAAVVALEFYEHLFELRPDFRPLFPDDLDIQRGKLVSTLATVVQSLHQLEDVLDEVRKLGQRHVGYKVKPEDYQPVGEALVFALKNNLDGHWSDELQDAWVAAYTALSGVMIDAAGEVQAA